jgi:hypothetical protein
VKVVKKIRPAVAKQVASAKKKVSTKKRIAKTVGKFAAKKGVKLLKHYGKSAALGALKGAAGGAMMGYGGGPVGVLAGAGAGAAGGAAKAVKARAVKDAEKAHKRLFLKDY